MRKKFSYETVLLKLFKVHGLDKIDFSLFTEYVDSREKIPCICMACGHIFSPTISSLFRGTGCKFCQNQRIAFENKTDYSSVVENLLNKIPEHISVKNFPLPNKPVKDIYITIECQHHGLQLKAAKVIMYKSTNICLECSYEVGAKKRIKYTYEQAVQEATVLHKGKYTYPSSCENFDLTTKVEISCPTHGIVPQTFRNHLYEGYGCKYCNTFTYSKLDYVNICTKYNNTSNLYVLFFSNDSESFYKIGITVSMDTRIYSLGVDTSKNYTIVPLLVLKGDSGFIWDLEKTFHRLYKKYRQKPLINFAGYTECFSNIDGILDHIPFDQVEVITDLLSHKEIAA